MESEQPPGPGPTPGEDPADPTDTAGASGESNDLGGPGAPGGPGAEGGPGAQGEPGRPTAEGLLSSAIDWFKSLRRSSSDRMLTGVAGGLAERTGVPALVIRAGFILAAIAGVGIPVYLIAWVLVPTDRGTRLADGGGLRDLVALGLVVVAGLMLAGQVAGSSTAELVWRSVPWALMLLGAALVLQRRESRSGPGAEPTPGGGDGVTPPASADQTPTTAQVATLATTQTARQMAVVGRDVPTGAGAVPRRTWRPAMPVIGLLTWCAVLVMCGVLGVLVLAGVFDVGPGVVAATALVVFGAGLVVSAFRGRARGLILPSLVIAAVLGGLAAVDVRVDNTEGAFNLTVTDPAQLPTSLRTSFSESSLNFADLELKSDRYLRIDQTAGTLDVILPRNVNVELKTRIGAGDGYIARLDRETALYNDPGLARKWLETGVPEGGDPVDPEFFRSDSGTRGLSRIGWWTSSAPIDSGIDVRDQRKIDQGAEFTLQLDIDMGVGSVRIIDPRWSRRSVQKLRPPTQLCAVGGGERGVVKPCGDIPESRRVALCINDNGYLVDCREDRPATPDWPRVAACRGYLGDEVPCDEVDIRPVGAQLTTPGLTDEGEPGDDDPESPPGTIRMPDPPETAGESETGASPPATTAPMNTAPTNTAPTMTAPDATGGRP